MKRSRSLLAVAAAAFLLAGRAGAGIQVALVPSAAQVALGADFQVTLRVTQAGSLFNAYEAVLDYDPTAITFVLEPLSVQEGAAMRGACGQTFQSFHAVPPQLSIEHSLLCPGTSLTGPGDLYVLHFRAGSTPRMTGVGFASLNFYNGGPTVPVTSSTPASILVGSPTDAVEAAGAIPRLGVSPNPFSGQAVLRIAMTAGGAQTIRIHDPRGRVVRQLASGRFEAGERTLVWDGRDAGGIRLPAGIYWIVASGESARVARRVTLLR